MDDAFSVAPERLGEHSSLVRQERAIAGQIEDLLIRARQFSILPDTSGYQSAYSLSQDLEHYFAATSDTLAEAGDLFQETSMLVDSQWQHAEQQIRKILEQA